MKKRCFLFSITWRQVKLLLIIVICFECIIYKTDLFIFTSQITKIFVSSIINPLAVEFIYLATSAECAGPINRPTADKRFRFHEQMKMMKSQYFAFYTIYGGFLNCWLFIFGGFLKFWWFFWWKTYQTLPPCKNCPTGQPAKPGQYYQQKTKHLKKMAACSHHCPLWHEHCHWGIGIPGYTFESMNQAQAIHHISWALLPR